MPRNVVSSIAVLLQGHTVWKCYSDPVFMKLKCSQIAYSVLPLLRESPFSLAIEHCLENHPMAFCLKVCSLNVTNKAA